MIQAVFTSSDPVKSTSPSNAVLTSKWVCNPLWRSVWTGLNISNSTKTYSRSFNEHVSLVIIFSTTFLGYSDSAFFATFDTRSPTVTNPIIFNNALLNPGDHYNPETGIYTVPVDGTYELMFNLVSITDSSYNAYIYVDEVRVSSLIIDTEKSFWYSYPEDDIVHMNSGQLPTLNLFSSKQINLHKKATQISLILSNEN